jgi:hypothetical protein
MSLPGSGALDGSADLLSILDESPESYRTWALSYYRRDLPAAAIAAIYQHQPLTEHLITTLNPAQRLTLLTRDIAEIRNPASHQPQLLTFT